MRAVSRHLPGGRESWLEWCFMSLIDMENGKNRSYWTIQPVCALDLVFCLRYEWKQASRVARVAFLHPNEGAAVIDRTWPSGAAEKVIRVVGDWSVDVHI